MQVLPINSTNFQGQFKRTTDLERLIKFSDYETLNRFNKVLERAKKVDDKKVFEISTFINTDFSSWGKFSNYHFNLLSHPENDEKRTRIEDIKSFEHIHHSDKHKNQILLVEKFGKVLKSFLPTLEEKYPQVVLDKSIEELRENIYNKLI